MGRWSRAGIALVLCLVACGARAVHAAGIRAASVRDRDWKNGALDLGSGRFVFVGGRYAELTDEGMCSVCLTIGDVSFGDVDGDGAEEAIVIIQSNLGGAGTSSEAYVFGLVAGKPVLRAHIDGGDRGDGGLQSVSVAAGEVIVRRLDLAASDNVCCPSRVLIERWRWREGRLVKSPGAARVRKRKARAWYLRP
jgi:hypothetical protein